LLRAPQVAKAEAFIEAEDFDALDEWIHEEVIERLSTYSVDQHKLDVPTASDPAPAGENEHITRRGLASFGVHPLLQGKSVQRITHAEGARCRCRGSVRTLSGLGPWEARRG
jgi:hypothetical protein